MTLTKWFSPHKSTLFAIVCTIFLLSCTTTNVPKSSKTAAKKNDLINKVGTNISAEQLVSQALTKNSAEAVSLFIQASELYLKENKPQKALWLANQTAVLTQQPLQKYKLTVVTAKSLLILEQAEKAYQAIVQANKIIQEQRAAKENNATNKEKLTHNTDYYQTLSKIQTYRELPIEALAANLRAYSTRSTTNSLINDKSDIATTDNIDSIWQQLSQLSQWQHQQLVKMSPPNIEGWSQLLSFANKFGDDDTRFQRYLTQWQRAFPQHPAQYVVEKIKQSQQIALEKMANNANSNINVSENNIHKQIAIIIPLSGRQIRAGKVVQQGILAAYNNKQDTRLHFIDSAALDMTTLAEQLSTLNIDYVIGPLLKENVNEYLALENITVPTLLLNFPTTAALQSHQVVLSMRPEDEAIQAATTLSYLQYQQPLILSHQDTLSRRIAQKFSQQWQHITGKSPETVFFNNDAKMQKQLQASLGVDLSQQRTKALDNRIKYTIKSELRNRRDIDMIYIVGSPLETKLLKPYIDVSISPFSDIIPVYASSRSHSVKTDKSDNQDLSGLAFTEIPWKISSKQQNKILAEQTKTLWPNRSDSLQTIFAMGFDSLSLIDKISAMKSKPYVRHYGQTGILQLDANNILKRSLVWGKYVSNTVQEIAVD